MAKEHIVALWCDYCIESSVREEAVTITVLADDGALYDLEVCPGQHHKTPYAVLAADAPTVGRLHGTEGSLDPEESLRAAYYDEDDLSCPLGCNKSKPFKSLQGKRQHLTNKHGAGEG